MLRTNLFFYRAAFFSPGGNLQLRIVIDKKHSVWVGFLQIAACSVSGVVLNSSAVQAALSAIRDCALIMRENASYVQRELPNVEIADPLRSQTAEVCKAMFGTGHNIISELFEIDELLKSDAESAIISSRLVRSIRWLWEDIFRLHQLVMALRADSQEDQNYTLGLILVEESAANILNAFNRAKAAVDAAASDSNEKRNA